MGLEAIQPGGGVLMQQLAQSAAGGRGFDSILTKASAGQAEAGRSQDAQLRHASQQLVSNALIQPLLKQMRDSPFKVKMFHGGLGEDAFGQKLDMILSDRIAKSTNFPIVDAVYRSLSRHAGRSTGQAVGGRLTVHG